ncbi:MAG: histidinol dehydrogenase [Desulfobacteraceae bacterium]|nr:histidinol dehydrogenase [Desulfobacteraceae bacterium]
MKIWSYPSKSGENRLLRIVQRGRGFRKKDVTTVTRMLEDVRKRGDEALLDYTRRFDAPRMEMDGLTVSLEEREDAMHRVDMAFRETLKRAVGQVESFHRKQLKRSWFTTEREGTFLGQMIQPVGAAGVYVPGGKEGKTPLVSSVLMGAIPAKVAGVERIALATPPTSDGSVNPHLLAAAHFLGIQEIYKIGSAWAIAALAFGTTTVAPVDVIVGPGNVYVTLAKKLVSGTVGIDMLAGPSEILVIADADADPVCIAADLLSQAEHDPLSSAILVTDSRKTANAVAAALPGQLDRLDRAEIAGESLRRYGAIFVTEDLDAAVELANRVAPEHLELQVRDPFQWFGRIRNAGAVFMGRYTPEPVGDYIAGPNHVLPTAGTARFSSALSVDHFLKKTSVIHYSQKAFEREADDVIRLAEIEGLGAHANAVRMRTHRS